MLIGYARVGPTDADARLQLEALKRVGCGPVFVDERMPAGAQRRPLLDRTLAQLRSHDVLIVWRLDRLAGSLAELVRLIRGLSARGIGFRSLCESIDSTRSDGAGLYHFVGALADFERDLINQRTQAGLADARRRGVRVGRKPKLSSEQVGRAQRLIDAGESADEVARTLGVSRATLYRALPAPMSNRRTEDLFASMSQ